MPTQDQYMLRAIELAERASGNTSPNPLVGAVIVRDNQIVAEGWHKQAGLAHAEVVAIQDAKDKNQNIAGATIYVSLEPCSHHGKTPPCTQAIIDAGISKVVYATSDTDHTASGGADVLTNAGLTVIGGVCEQRAKHTNRFFFHYQENNTPYVIAKFASSLDGRTATHSGNSQWITGKQAREQGHVARQAVDAIVIGAQTAINDQPQLTVRNALAHKHTQAAHPLRIVLDSKGRVPVNNAVFNKQLPASTLLVTTDAIGLEHEQQLLRNGVDVLKLPRAINSEYPDLNLLLKNLGERQIQSLLVEGGANVHGSFLDNKLVNEVWAFIAPIIIGGKNALPSIGGNGTDLLEDALKLKNTTVETFDSDLLIKGTV